MPLDLPDPDRPLRIGTRGSPLALAQARETRDRLMAAHGLPEAAFAIIVDPHHRRPGAGPPALRRSAARACSPARSRRRWPTARIDIAVHSMKDMPTLQPAGLAIAALLPRADPRDAFVTLGRATLATLPAGSVVGTSSLRRAAQTAPPPPRPRASSSSAATSRPGSRKLADGVAVATFLAMAGLDRLGLDLPRQPIEPEEMLPAVAQGAIGVEARAADAAYPRAARRDPRRRHRPPARGRARLPRRPRRLLPDPDRRPRRARRRPPAPARRDPAPRRLRAPRPRRRGRRRRRRRPRRRLRRRAARPRRPRLLRRLSAGSRSVDRRASTARARRAAPAAGQRRRARPRSRREAAPPPASAAATRPPAGRRSPRSRRAPSRPSSASALSTAQPPQAVERLVGPPGRHEDMVVMEGRHHVGADPGLGQRRRHRRGQPDRLEARLHAERDPPERRRRGEPGPPRLLGASGCRSAPRPRGSSSAARSPPAPPAPPRTPSRPGRAAGRARRAAARGRARRSPEQLPAAIEVDAQPRREVPGPPRHLGPQLGERDPAHLRRPPPGPAPPPSPPAPRR